VSRLHSAALLPALAILGMAFPARAQLASSAWSQAAMGIPSSTVFIARVNVYDLQAYPQLRQQAFSYVGTLVPSFNWISQMNASCGLDPGQVIQDVVVAADGNAAGITYLSIRSIDPLRVAACAARIATGNSALVATTNPTTGLTGYAAAGSKPVFFAASFGKSTVIAIVTVPSDAALLQKWTAAGGCGSSCPAHLIDVNSTMWGISVRSKTLGSGTTMSSAYLTGTLASGNINYVTHLVLGSSSDATKTAANANTELAAEVKTGKVPPVYSSITISTLGSEVVFKWTASPTLLFGGVVF
jgi:hypothetical protein